MRSRLYLVRAEGEDADPDERTLTRLKANYAGVGEVIRARWTDGAFVALDAPTGVDRAAIGAKADSNHGHSIAQVSNLQTTLTGLQSQITNFDGGAY